MSALPVKEFTKNPARNSVCGGETSEAQARAHITKNRHEISGTRD